MPVFFDRNLSRAMLMSYLSWSGMVALFCRFTSSLALFNIARPLERIYLRVARIGQGNLPLWLFIWNDNRCFVPCFLRKKIRTFSFPFNSVACLRTEVRSGNLPADHSESIKSKIFFVNCSAIGSRVAIMRSLSDIVG